MNPISLFENNNSVLCPIINKIISRKLKERLFPHKDIMVQKTTSEDNLFKIGDIVEINFMKEIYEDYTSSLTPQKI